MPEGFSFPANEQLWIPMSRDASAERRGDQSYESSVGVTAVGRLANGVTPEQASDEAAAIFARLAKLYPRSNAGVTTNVVPVAEGAVNDANRVINTMFAAVLLVLLIACANVASLIFVRPEPACVRSGHASRARRAAAATHRADAGARASSSAAFGVIGGLVLAAVALHLTEVAIHSLAETELPPGGRSPSTAASRSSPLASRSRRPCSPGIVPAWRASRPDVDAHSSRWRPHRHGHAAQQVHRGDGDRRGRVLRRAADWRGDHDARLGAVTATRLWRRRQRAS